MIAEDVFERRWEALSIGKKYGLSLLETLIALCVIGALFGMVVAKYQRVSHEAQKAALRAELVNIRTSIRLFAMMNSRNPRSLKELMEKKVMLPARIGKGANEESVFTQRYLMPNAVDAEGNLLDSFGHVFQYDPRSGEVRAATKGYENW